MPEEQPGTLVENKTYLLVSDGGVRVGRLQLWGYYAAWGGPFYDEFDLVMDIVVPGNISVRLKQSIERIAKEHSVQTEDHGSAAFRPWHIPKRSVLRRLWSAARRW